MESPEPDRAARFLAQPLGIQRTCHQPLGQLEDPIWHPASLGPPGWGHATIPWHEVSFHLPFSTKGTQTKPPRSAEGGSPIPQQGPSPTELGDRIPRAIQSCLQKTHMLTPCGHRGRWSSTHRGRPAARPWGQFKAHLACLGYWGVPLGCVPWVYPRPLWGP